jgi:transposase
MFQNAKIVIDSFHLVQLISRSLNKKRIRAMKNKDKNRFLQAINEVNELVSDYMKTSIKTLTEFKKKIFNTFSTNYHNGFIEGNNNFIKVLKRIAFGFRSFRRFKARIMICKGLIKLQKKKANACALAL